MCIVTLRKNVACHNLKIFFVVHEILCMSCKGTLSVCDIYLEKAYFRECEPTLQCDRINIYYQNQNSLKGILGLLLLWMT